MAFEKPVKEFLAKFQKDLDVLQKSLKKEGDDLVAKVKQAASKESLDAKRKEIEKLVQVKLKKFEPTLDKFMTELNSNAKKAGVDLSQLEKKVRSNLKTAQSRLHKVGEDVRKRAKTAKTAKTADTTAKKPAAASKQPAKKGPRRKGSTVAAAQAAAEAAPEE